jgi:hypothetical protein
LAKPIDLEKTPFDVIDTRIRTTGTALRESARALSLARMDAVTVGDVERALVDVLQLDEIFDLLQRDIDGEMIVTLLRDYDFTSRPERLCEVELGESILPPHYPLALREAKVKLKGEIWVAHKYNYDRKLKMHLGTGDLYAGKDRVPCERIKKADLLTLRTLITRKNASISLPPLAV